MLGVCCVLGVGALVYLPFVSVWAALHLTTGVATGFACISPAGSRPAADWSKREVGVNFRCTFQIDHTVNIIKPGAFVFL